MDILTELFRETGLRRRLLDVRALPREGVIRFPCDRSVGCHVVLVGPVYVHAPRLREPLRLEAGDIAIMARGCEHTLATSANALSGDVTAVGAAASSVVSGAYQLWSTPVQPFFAELPEWFVLRAHETAQMESIARAVSLLEAEARSDALGRDTVVHALLDVLFTLLLREIVARRNTGDAGWSQAFHDAPVRVAIQQMHDNCAHAWTVATLAREAGVSRSALAARFRAAMGTTPLAYLRTVRLQRAMRLLAEEGQTLEQIARMVGYHDAFGFSKAFKRAVGVTPGEFRRRNAADEQLPWRFPAEEAVG